MKAKLRTRNLKFHRYGIRCRPHYRIRSERLAKEFRMTDRWSYYYTLNQRED